MSPVPRPVMSAGLFDDVDPSRLPPPPPGLIRLAARRARAAVPDDRRRSRRHPLATDLLVRPVDAEFAPAGPAFRAVATDLSTGGLCLYHTRHIPTGLLAVRLPAKGRRETTVILSVERSAAAGRYYEAAGPFAARVGYGSASARAAVRAEADDSPSGLKVWRPLR